MERSSVSADYWRRFFRSSGADIFEVIEHAIFVAASDYPDEFRSKRDGIVEKFYTVLLPPCFGCDRVASQGAEAEAEEGRGSVNSKADSCIVDLEFSNRAVSNCTDEAAALTAEMEEEDRTLEQVLWIKDILSDHQDQSDDVLLELLRKLQLMELTVDVLEKTKIGKAVNVLHKHNSKRIRHLSRSLIDGWKVIVDEWISATSVITGISDSLNPYAEDEEAGLPSPPLDEGALFAAPTTSMMLSGFFDGMDDDGNFRNNNNLDEKWEIGRDPEENHGTVKKQQPEKQSIVVEEQVETRRQLANSKVKLQVGGKRISKGQANSQNIVSKQTKPLVAESAHGRLAELTSEKQKCTQLKIKLPRDTAKLQKKPPTILQNRSKCSEEELVQAKLEAAKRKLNEGYQQAENAKKQRTIQVMELQDLPKQAGNTPQPLHKFINQSRNWPNGQRH
ncbi:probable mediator of RNA polymerase II transcription subunit 26b [Zingiber officinale]|uniref:probable mediator of RNA polymerase II transcription subunit 26b n=1 Tax=Zingiber officinale TaxID=94328 RepID=UPI001C4A9E8F|nr:probable mediator of RNA polymerase II transcription subunit 26b [Zingiber officinale]XP_042373250.1 probable mediator of RNA polymerase II transcription subunit 26b [Zingiber officinale]